MKLIIELDNVRDDLKDELKLIATGIIDGREVKKDRRGDIEVRDKGFFIHFPNVSSAHAAAQEPEKQTGALPPSCDAACSDSSSESPENAILTKSMLRKHIANDWGKGSEIEVVIETPDGTRYPVKSMSETVPGGPYVISARTLKDLNDESVASGAIIGVE